MALDVLVLGGFVFTDFAVPELLPGGGAHQFNTKKLMGGDRVIDALGPDDENRIFAVLHVGANAVNDALTLDAYRIAGQALPYSNGVEARTVVVVRCPFRLEKFNVVHQDIELMTVDNPAGSGGGAGSASPTADQAQASDTATANAILDQNQAAANETPLTTPTNSGGIGSA